ncbi:uncharacterized protein IL334_006507 [Kwoniella shivajii]|uniref:NF-kappa-B-activating protein C-terminal domain-containing protein n=1 Tax=Kwoniella shivajii TaxID=564305 RepID=A0ABZ1D650_9TREE|nr:hypothetical protein IL334_006507 [Kwoniella shivajii]
MATVHPSRMRLVPGGSHPPIPPASSDRNGEGSREEELRRKLMERKRGDEGGSRERDDRRERDSRDDRRETRDDRRDRDGDRRDRDRGDDRIRDRDGEAFRSYELRRDERDGRDGRDGRDRRSNQDERPRRASPSYRPYDLSAPPAPGGPPPPQAQGQGYGYGRRDDLPGGPAPPLWRPDGPPHGMGGGAGSGAGQRGGWQNPPPPNRFNGNMDFERRREERENNPLSIWPDSPKRPYQDEDEIEAERKKNKAKAKAARKSKSSKSKHKSSKHRSSKKYSDASSSETDSEEEERRRRRRKEKERERRKRHDSVSDSDDDRERRRKRRKSKSRSEIRDENDEPDLADQWVEKGGEVVLIPTEKDRERVESHYQKASPEKEIKSIPVVNDDSDDEIGPQLPSEVRQGKMDRHAFANMRPGEGEAYAAYAESGERIPRRGEIGMDANIIEKFENSGYVMSGSRHQRMNAVRMRKENQVINEAEKRAILKLQREEKEKKEGMIITQFKEMMEENLRKQGINRP